MRLARLSQVPLFSFSSSSFDRGCHRRQCCRHVFKQGKRHVRLQGHHLQALEVFLRIRDPGVFAYVTRFHLHAAAARHAPQLADVDEDAAAALFVAQREAAPAQAVAAELVRSLRAAERSRDSERVHVARRRLFKYLHALFAQERAAPHSYHDLQARLPL